MNLTPPPMDNRGRDTNDIYRWLRQLYDFLQKLHLNRMYVAETTWDAGSIADGDEEAKEITVTGANLGDYVLASLSIDVADLVLSAQVTAAGTVTASLLNNTGGAIDLASATLYVMVIQKTH